YCSATLPRLSLKMTTWCHSVFSLRSPEFLSRQLSDVAIRRLTTASPEFSRRTSGSAPRFPTKMTLLTLPAMILLRAYPKLIPPHLTGWRITAPPPGVSFPQGFRSLYVLDRQASHVKLSAGIHPG